MYQTLKLVQECVITLYNLIFREKINAFIVTKFQKTLDANLKLIINKSGDG